MAGTLRRVSGGFVVLIGLVALAAGAFATPAAAAPSDDVNQECNGAFRGNPEGSLAITSTPAGGDIGPSVDVLDVAASWDVADWSGTTLDKILDCVTVDGALRDDLSAIDKPTPNDGAEAFTIAVDGLAPGTEVCARVRLSGQPNGANASTQKSNVVCWDVVAATTQPPGTNEGPDTVTVDAGAPSPEVAPANAVSDPAVAAVTTDAVVAGIQVSREAAPAVLAADAAGAAVAPEMLAATGTSGRLATTGAALVGAGLLLLLWSRSPRRPEGSHYRS